MSTHYLKIATEYFDPVSKGDKTFEIREDDRCPRFDAGDILVLQEHNVYQYTGRVIHVRVSYIMRDSELLPKGYCAMSIELHGISY